MFAARIFQCRLQSVQKYFESEQQRNYGKKSANKMMLLGGGLEKLQGSIKEEKYFRSVNLGLLSKFLEQPDKKDSCLMNKHKICNEEVFFMSQNAECVQLLSDRWKPNITVALGSSKLPSEQDDDKPIENTTEVDV